MNSRSGVSFVPPMHDSQEGSSFYTVDNVMSAPNDAVKVGDWMPNPNKFSAEAPRTYEQCLHLDGGGTRGKCIPLRPQITEEIIRTHTRST